MCGDLLAHNARGRGRGRLPDCERDSTNEANIIFNSSSANDASLKLAGQLLATKLGIKAGKGDATCLNSAGTIAAADNALTAYGYNTKPTGAARQTDLSLSSQLEYWNRTGTCL